MQTMQCYITEDNIHEKSGWFQWSLFLVFFCVSVHSKAALIVFLPRAEDISIYSVTVCMSVQEPCAHFFSTHSFSVHIVKMGMVLGERLCTT